MRYSLSYIFTRSSPETHPYKIPALLRDNHLGWVPNGSYVTQLLSYSQVVLLVGLITSNTSGQYSQNSKSTERPGTLDRLESGKYCWSMVKLIGEKTSTLVYTPQHSVRLWQSSRSGKTKIPINDLGCGKLDCEEYYICKGIHIAIENRFKSVWLDS